MTRLRRRALMLGILLTIGGLIGRGVEAQPARLVKIGALTASWGPTPVMVGLRDGLQERGYRENEHFVIGVRFTQGKPGDLPEAARDLVRHGVDIIFAAGGGNEAKAAQMATNRIPIVFVGAGDPVGLGLVNSFARPGANITGIADLGAELAPKQMQIFRELVPGLRRVLLAYDATNAGAVAEQVVYRDAARLLGLTVVERPLRTEEEAQAAITGVRKLEVDGMFSPRHISLNIPGFIMEIGPKRAMPTMFSDAFYVERGGLASYSANPYELGRQAARLVDRILKGTKPADLPVEQATKLELVINLKTAKALGLTITQALQLQADRLIE